jgi:hypothetical protein
VAGALTEINEPQLSRIEFVLTFGADSLINDQCVASQPAVVALDVSRHLQPATGFIAVHYAANIIHRATSRTLADENHLSRLE